MPAETSQNCDPGRHVNLRMSLSIAVKFYEKFRVPFVSVRVDDHHAIRTLQLQIRVYYPPSVVNRNRCPLKDFERLL